MSVWQTNSGRIETGFRIVAAALGWFAIITQYSLMAANAGPHLVERTINFFSYFTIVSNILVALAMTLPWLAPSTWAGRFFLLPAVRTAIVAYIIVVFVVYHTMLSRLYHPQGLRFACDIILHYVMPPLFVLDWALFVDKRVLSWRLTAQLRGSDVVPDLDRVARRVRGLLSVSVPQREPDRLRAGAHERRRVDRRLRLFGFGVGGDW